jgi:hypothetical protein
VTLHYANLYSSTLTGAIASGATSATVVSTTGSPDVPFVARIKAEGANKDEFVTVTAKSGSLTITRATEAIGDGTQVAQAHASGATVEAVLTAALLDQIIAGFDPAACQFTVDISPAPAGTNYPVAFVDFYDYGLNPIVAGIPPAASGLTYAAGVFTAAVDGLWHVQINAQGVAVANDADWWLIVPTSWGGTMKGVAIIKKLAASTDLLGEGCVVGLKAGDTFHLGQDATAAQVPASDLYMLVDRIG